MKILVIDDEPLIHISIEKLIQACSKEDEVLHAYNGHEMLKMLEENDIAMAYVDIKMPGPSGLEAIKMGKAISPDTRYYIMTGFNEFEYAKQAVKLKVEDYLMKPLDKKDHSGDHYSSAAGAISGWGTTEKCVPYLAGKCFKWEKYWTGGI